jgi:hypothetical protein
VEGGQIDRGLHLILDLQISSNLEVMACLALDQQQRIAEDIAMEMKTKFIDAIIQACTVPIVGMLVPVLVAIAMAIIIIGMIILIIALLTPYIEPFFNRLEKGSDSPYMKMMMAISPIYYGLWSVKKKRMTRLSSMLGTGILTPFMEQGSDGGGGWGPLILLIFGAVMKNITTMYGMIEYRLAANLPRLAIQLVGLLVPPSIGNFMCGPLSAKIVRFSVATITHNVVHNANYALTHSLTQSVTQSVTEAMHRQEKHYYYTLFCYYQGKYCDYVAPYNQYASAGKNLNSLTFYPSQ